MKDKKNFKKLIQAEPNLAAFLTLFSFGTLARAAQFLVPLLIYTFLPSSKNVDFYFYWSTQSNLVAVFLATIWPGALMSVIVKERTQKGESSALQISAIMLRRFLIFTVIVALIVAMLACSNYLGGPQLGSISQRNILWGLAATITCTSTALAISEIANALRKFGLGYQSLLISALVQVLVLVLTKNEQALPLSFLLGSLAQLGFSIYLLRPRLNIFTSAIAEVLPSKNTIGLMYIGSMFTLLTAHISYRILGDDQTGAIAAFAMASMLTIAPQQLFIQQLSTVAAVAMTESFHGKPQDFERVSNKWRNRLFRISLLLGLGMAIISCAAYAIFPYISWVKDSWITVAGIMVFLSLPLAISGLITWFARLATTAEKINVGVSNQITVNVITIGILLYCARFTLPFSTPLALAISAFIQLISIPIFKFLIFPKKSQY